MLISLQEIYNKLQKPSTSIFLHTCLGSLEVLIRIRILILEMFDVRIFLAELQRRIPLTNKTELYRSLCACKQKQHPAADQHRGLID